MTKSKSAAPSEKAQSTPVATPAAAPTQKPAPVSAKAAEPAAPAIPVGQMSGAVVSVKSLLESGAHFGHQTQRWNPRMSPYIFGERNGIHIINLDLSVKLWEKARRFIVDTISRGGSILFVGTKQQSRDTVREEATRCGAFYVTDRWLGGTLSNFTTIRTAIERMNKLEELVTAAEQENSKVKIVKKERVRIHKELDKLQKSLGGIRDMRKLPTILFVADLVKEEIGVAEARKLNIPVVGIADTNSDPTQVAFPIPSNDDAPKVTKLLVAAVGDAVLEGKRIYQSSDAARGSGNSEGRSGARRVGRGSSRNSGAAATPAAAEEETATAPTATPAA